MNARFKKYESISFGVMLALAVDKNAYTACKDNLLRADQKAIEALCGRLTIIKQKKTAALWQSDIPDESCPVGDSYLIQNKELLLELFSSGRKQDICSKLIDHMNQCMTCFEFFGETLRDFYRAPQIMMKEK